MTDDDELLFSAEDDAPPELPAGPPWRLLIVDDEIEIHSVSKLALSSFRLDNRELEFLHAYSGAQAKQILAAESDIGLVLLDVIMETDDAGLRVVQYIREELGNSFMRIILRTGQPGQAPERRVITEYDINDYKEKTELTSTKLYSVVYTGLSSYRDLRALEQARAELAKRNQETQRAFDDLEKFSYMASHDLQAPLRTINVYVERLMTRHAQELSADAQDTLARVSGAAQRLQSLIVSLLKMAQVDSRVMHLCKVNTGEVLDDVRESFAAAHDATGATIEFDETSMPTLVSEPFLLRQLLQNLVENGLKYQPAGNVPKLEISALESEDAWEFRVRDNGIGIAEEYREKVFEEFERLHTRSEYEGSGIGLATCKRIIQRLDGTIRVESAPDTGSVFVFTLPKHYD